MVKKINVENIHLKSIENHIRLKDPERHKATLLEIIQKEKLDDYENNMVETLH